MKKLLTIGQLAKLLDQSKVTVSRRVTELENSGRLKTKPGPNRSKLVDPDDYKAALETTVDGSRQINERLQAAARDGIAVVDEHLRELQDNRRQYEAHKSDILEIEVGLRNGTLVRAADLNAASTRVGQSIVDDLDALVDRGSEELVEVHARGGTEGVRKWLEKRTAKIMSRASHRVEVEFGRLGQPEVLQ